jgi:hypothetical protein
MRGYFVTAHPERRGAPLERTYCEEVHRHRVADAACALDVGKSPMPSPQQGRSRSPDGRSSVRPRGYGRRYADEESTSSCSWAAIRAGPAGSRSTERRRRSDWSRNAAAIGTAWSSRPGGAARLAGWQTAARRGDRSESVTHGEPSTPRTTSDERIVPPHRSSKHLHPDIQFCA